MPRLKSEFVERVEDLSHRIVDVAEACAKARRSRRIVEQIYGSGSSVGANTCEAAEAMSDPDFCRALGIAHKELSESRYWLRFVVRRGWVKADRLTTLHSEAEELQRVFGTMISKTRKRLAED